MSAPRGASASLDHPAAIAPGYHIWTASQLPWLDLAGDLPRRKR